MKFKFLFVFIAISAMASAQVKLGLKAGVGLPEIKVKEFNGQATYDEIEAGDRSVGFHAGAFLRINILKFYVQPEGYYTKVNHTFKADKSNGGIEDLKVNFDRFDIPLLGGVKFGPARLNLGPVASINLASDSPFKGGLENATWGYQLGVGLDLKDITLDLRYEGPFSKTADAVTIGGTTYQTDMRTNQVLISLGYSFL